MNEVNLVPSLLQAIVNIDGEALVMHAGDKPYVVSPTGQVELASRGLTLDAVSGIVAQLLPLEFQNALDEFGAVQYALPPQEDFPQEQFTVVVARGGDDVWAEIRRKRVPEDDAIPKELFAASAPPAAPVASVRAPAPPAPAPVAGNAHEAPAATVAPRLPAVPVVPVDDDDVIEIELPHASRSSHAEDELSLPEATHLWPGGQRGDVDHDDHDLSDMLRPREEPAGSHTREEQPPRVAPPVANPAPGPAAVAPPRHPSAPAAPGPPLPAPAKPAAPAPPPKPVTPEAPPVTHARPTVPVTPPPAPPAAPAAPVAPAGTSRPPVPAPPPRPAAPPPRPAPPVQQVPPATPRPAPTRHPSAAAAPGAPPPAVVLPMSRNPIRLEAPPPLPAADTLLNLERLLRTAAARGASTLYLSSDAQPSVRVDGELQNLVGEPVHTSSDVISLLLTLMPDRSHETLRTGATTEWICDIEDVGRVRCMSFSDHRGPGGVFRLMPVRSVSVDQLGLPREVQSLAIEPEGLVLIAGSRSSGKRTLISALVDLINRTRRDHVITIEREVNMVHDRGSSFVSQREVRGTDDDVLAAARAAIREDPDVLVLDQIRSGLLMNVALEAAASGHLVIGGFSAHNATESIDRILDLYAPEYARQVQLALADNLRGVVVQVLLPKIGGGRVAAREVLLNTAAVAGVIAEGKTSQLPMAIEGGRRSGMVPLNDALVGYVQSGIVDVREAYRHVIDRPAFVALLKRQGVDTSAVERLA